MQHNREKYTFNFKQPSLLPVLKILKYRLSFAISINFNAPIMFGLYRAVSTITLAVCALFLFVAKVREHKHL